MADEGQEEVKEETPVAEEAPVVPEATEEQLGAVEEKTE